jgi:uncharacterized protein (DUF427 family)
MPDYPSALVEADHVEPVPRRIRAVLAGQTVVDTTNARYVWERPFFPVFYVPLADVSRGVLVDEGTTEETTRGDVHFRGLQVGDERRPAAARVLHAAKVEGLDETVRFEWSALDAWYEEDEQVFVHPRSPYVRVDSIRSTRRVRVEEKGVVLAESSSPVLVFETGLPTRYYLNRTDVDFSRLVHSETQTACPYKGVTSDYWSSRAGDTTHPDVAWSYAFPMRELLPIAGLIAFYNEKVDIFVDDVKLERPHTRVSRSR